MRSRTITKNQWIEIAFIILIALLSLMLWDTIFVFPFKLIVVFLHESSHAIAAIFSGGEVQSMEINFDLSGKCEISGGNAIVIASAGYIGSLILGLLFYWISNNKNKQKLTLLIIFTILLLFSINLVSDSRIHLTILVFIITLFLLLKYLPQVVNSYILKSIGVISSMYVLFDIKEDILSHDYYTSDATILNDLTGISEMIWGLLWFALAIVGIFFLITSALKKSQIKR